MSDNTIKVMGREYSLDSLDEGSLKMIGLYKKWKDESNEHKIAFLKSEGACRDLAREIYDRLEKKKQSTPYISSVNESGGEVIEFKKK